MKNRKTTALCAQSVGWKGLEKRSDTEGCEVRERERETAEYEADTVPVRSSYEHDITDNQLHCSCGNKK